MKSSRGIQIIVKGYANNSIWGMPIFVNYFFNNDGTPKESIFLTTIYGLYFSHHYTH